MQSIEYRICDLLLGLTYFQVDQRSVSSDRRRARVPYTFIDGLEEGPDLTRQRVHSETS